MGEYARSLAIAQGAAVRWPRASIQFILSREAPYAAHTPFPATLLAASPTFHSAAVIEVMEKWRPDLVVFDNAGRTAQLRAARRCGACVVFVSARRRQRNKAFRFRWMLLLDEHWIAYPEFIAGGLSFLERLKLKFMGRPAVRFLDVILARDRGPGAAGGRGEDCAAVPARTGAAEGGYVLVVPGGGTGHPGAGDAIAGFLRAAQGLAAAGIDTVFVGPAGPAGPAADAAAARLVLLGPVPQARLGELMRGARLVIANGGSTLLQAIACGRASIGVPIAGDQDERIRRCAAAGAAVAAPLDAAVMLETATDLLHDQPRLDALAGRAAALGLADGVDAAVRALAAMLANR